MKKIDTCSMEIHTTTKAPMKCQEADTLSYYGIQENDVLHKAGPE